MKTDLIVELAKLNNISSGYSEKVVKFKKYNVTKTVSNITSDFASKKLGKDCGTYVTIDVKNFVDYDSSLFLYVQDILTKSLSTIFKEKCSKKRFSALVVGLGNIDIVCDSLGPITANKILVTRNMNFLDKDTNIVSVFKTSVLGKTGIESFEIVKGVAHEILPDIVIIIDSLVASNITRLCSSFQISSGGITPGSGVGNHRFVLNDKSLNIPTITIGVPMIIFADTLTRDIAKNFKFNNKTQKNLSKYSNLSVSPFNIDILVEIFARIISNAINKTLNPQFSINFIEKLKNN